MTYLPIDYYILLQKGYKNKPKISRTGFKKRTNIIMFNNLPVLREKETYFNKKEKIVKAVSFEEVSRCLQKKEAR